MARESQPARTGLTLALNKDIWRANFYRFCQLLEQENPDTPKLGSTSHPGDDPVRFRPWPGMGLPLRLIINQSFILPTILLIAGRRQTHESPGA
nr:type VI secretion system baseplate subunit TssG [Klebsiella sp. D5A]